jgi:regulator of sigma E protease
MVTTIAFIIVLGLMVFVHELGHFLVAKRTGVVVEEFAFGYPPRLLKYWQSEGKIVLDGQEMVIGRKTEVSRQVEVGARVVYESATRADGRAVATRIQAVPDGMSDDEAASQFGRPVSQVGQLTRGTEYTINLIPFGGYVRMLGEEDPTAPGSLASKSKRVRIAVLTAGASMNILLAVLIFAAMFMLGVPGRVASDTVMVAGVAPGSPAEAAGLHVGDIIASVDGTPVKTPDEMVKMTNERRGQPVALVITRGQTSIPVTITPRLNPPEGEGAMGVRIDSKVELVYYPLGQALWMGVQQTVGIIVLTLSAPLLLLRGLIPAEAMRPIGPYGIYQQTASAVQVSVQTGWWYPILFFTGFLNTALGLTNLLPIPALDGARIFFVVVEAIRGRRIDPAREGLIHLVGLAVLLVLMLVVTYYDFATPLTGIDWTRLY